MPLSIARPARLRANLDSLRDELAAVRLALSVPEAEEHRRLRDRAVRSIETHLDARLAGMDAPLLVAVFGPTGSGKSTITNTLAGHQVSRSGVLRPTTRQAVVWCHREDAERVRSSALASSGPLEVVADDHPLLRSVMIVDTPDIDSIATEHRRQTERILLMADAAIAVTTPQRYADAVPWELLEDVTGRGMPLLVVVNRLERRSSGAVTDLVSLLRGHRVAAVKSTDDVITVHEQRVKSDGRLSTAAVRRLVTEVERLAADRDHVIERGVSGAVSRVVSDARALADAVTSQAEDASRRWSVVESAYRGQLDEVERLLTSGDLVRGEVVERWKRLVGVGDLARVVSRGASRVRDVLLPSRIEDRVDVVGVEARDELVAMAIHRVGRADASTVAAWELDRAGADLLAATRPLDRQALDRRAGEEIDEWLAGLVDLVGSEGKSRFRLARLMTVGVNAVATLLLLGVFASTGGLTGGEVGVVAGTAAAQHTILEHLFGSATASRLAAGARRDLIERLGSVLWEDAGRFRLALDETVDDIEAAGRLEERARAVELTVEELFGG